MAEYIGEGPFDHPDPGGGIPTPEGAGMGAVGGSVAVVPTGGIPVDLGTPDQPSKKRRLGPAAILAIAWIIFVVGGALLAPYLPIPSTTETVDIPVGADGLPYFGQKKKIKQ